MRLSAIPRASSKRPLSMNERSIARARSRSMRRISPPPRHDAQRSAPAWRTEAVRRFECEERRHESAPCVRSFRRRQHLDDASAASMNGLYRAGKDYLALFPSGLLVSEKPVPHLAEDQVEGMAPREGSGSRADGALPCRKARERPQSSCYRSRRRGKTDREPLSGIPARAGCGRDSRE